MTLHFAGEYAESNSVLEAAEARIDELFTTSLSTQAGSFLTNDNLLPYEGEDFEKVMVNLVRAVNYAAMGVRDEALVEARKVDHKLNVINDRYAEKKNIYKEDAFARYLSGILYEWKGSSQELNDAFISYRKALETYRQYAADYGTPMPPRLAEDLLRVSEALHLDEEHAEYKRDFPDVRWISQSEMKGKGEIVVIAYTGRSPYKKDLFLDIPGPVVKAAVTAFSPRTLLRPQDLVPIRVALPEFVLQERMVDRMDLKVGEATAPGGIAEEIGKIAIKNLEDHRGRILARTVARVALKQLASAGGEALARKQGGELAATLIGLTGKVVAFATEEADKRSWRTLPGEIWIARIAVPPGTHDVELQLQSKSGAQSELFKNVSVKVGEKRFLLYRSPR